MKRIVLLGTGTGVGKTHLGALLVATWRRQGHPAWGLKPIESGVGDPDSTAVTPTAAARLAPGTTTAVQRGTASASGRPFDSASASSLPSSSASASSLPSSSTSASSLPSSSTSASSLPFDTARGGEPTDAERLWPGGPRPASLDWHHRALRAPISPHLAARQEGMELDLTATLEWIRQAEDQLVAMHDNTRDALSLVETAGGAFTPLSPTLTCARLAQALAPAFIVLVAPDALGVLHDVTATLLALRASGCPVHAVVLSESRPADASTGSNAGELERVVFPALGSAAPACAEVFRVARGAADVGPLLAAWAACAGDAHSGGDG